MSERASQPLSDAESAERGNGGARTPVAPQRGAAREIRVSLPLPPRECHQNRSGSTRSWREEAAVKRSAREYARAAVTRAHVGPAPRWERCAVSLHFRYPDKRRRDLFNFAGACKNYLDGMMDAGVFRDDSGIMWGTLSCEIDRDNPGVTITVREGAGYAGDGGR